MCTEEASTPSWVKSIRDLTDTTALVTVETREDGLVGYIVPTRTPFSSDSENDPPIQEEVGP